MFKMRSRKTALFCLLFLFIFSLSGTACAAVVPDQFTGPVVVVTATGTTTVEPDQARLSLAVVTNEKNLADAQEENSRITQKVMDVLRASGLEEGHIQTSGFNIHPQYDYTTKSSDLLGYQVRNEISAIILDISKVGVILDKAVSAGVNNVNHIAFEKANLDTAENEALLKAITRGREKAQVIASAAQMGLGGLVSIAEGYSTPVYPAVAKISLDTVAGMGGGPVPINPGELKVTASVTMVYQLN